MELNNLERINPSVRKIVSYYAEEFIRINDDNILSLMVYGSAAGEDFIPKVSDVNMLAVFKKIEIGDLKKNLKLIAWGRKRKIAAPLILSRRHIETSKDTFPLEFLEIKENYLLLFGEDIFSQVEIEKKYLRLFCEEQLKGKLIRIRQAYLELGLKRKGIEAILKKSFNALFPVFRSLLRLKHIEVPQQKEGVLRELEKHYEISARPFVALLRDKRNDEKIAGRSLEEFLAGYLTELEKLAEAVDKL